MFATALNQGPFSKLFSHLGLIFRRPARLQVAALCYRNGGRGPEVLLITSRGARRWIIPKGWPITRLSARKTAEREAFEEAGIVGEAAREPIGNFYSKKGLGKGLVVRTNILVFPLKVTDQTHSFPENGERDLAWLTPEDAMSRCSDAGLRNVLASRQFKSLLTARN